MVEVVRSESVEDDSLGVESVALSLVVVALMLPERLDDVLAGAFAGMLEGVLDGLFYGVLEGDEGGILHVVEIGARGNLYNRSRTTTTSTVIGIYGRRVFIYKIWIIVSG